MDEPTFTRWLAQVKRIRPQQIAALDAELATLREHAAAVLALETGMAPCHARAAAGRACLSKAACDVLILVAKQVSTGSRAWHDAFCDSKANSASRTNRKLSQQKDVAIYR